MTALSAQFLGAGWDSGSEVREGVFLSSSGSQPRALSYQLDLLKPQPAGPLLLGDWARCLADSFQTGWTPTLDFGAQVGKYLRSCIACSENHSLV